jgi:hypothetical protein
MNCDIIYLVKDDNGSQVECLLTREDTGDAVNITGATALLKFRKKKATTILFTLTNLTVAPIDLTAGEAVFRFSSENLNIAAGYYEGEVQVTFSDSNIETVYELVEFQVRDDF